MDIPKKVIIEFDEYNLIITENDTKSWYTYYKLISPNGFDRPIRWTRVKTTPKFINKFNELWTIGILILLISISIDRNLIMILFAIAIVLIRLFIVFKYKLY